MMKDAQHKQKENAEQETANCLNLNTTTKYLRNQST